MAFIWFDYERTGWLSNGLIMNVPDGCFRRVNYVIIPQYILSKSFFKEIKMLLFHIFNTETIDRSIVFKTIDCR